MVKTLPIPVRISKPCSEKWSDMQGDDLKRYCAQCNRHVHNLSAMSERKRAAYIRRAGRRLCIAYVQKPNGTVVLPSHWRSLRLALQPLCTSIASVLAAMLPFAFTSCATRDVHSQAATHCDTHPKKSVSRSDDLNMVPGEGPAPEELQAPPRRWLTR